MHRVVSCGPTNWQSTYSSRWTKEVVGLASVAGEWGNPGATDCITNGSVLSKIILLVRKFLPACKHKVYRAPPYVGIFPDTKLRTRLNMITIMKNQTSSRRSNTGQETAFERLDRPCRCFGIVLLFLNVRVFLRPARCCHVGWQDQEIITLAHSLGCSPLHGVSTLLKGLLLRGGTNPTDQL